MVNLNEWTPLINNALEIYGYEHKSGVYIYVPAWSKGTVVECCYVMPRNHRRDIYHALNLSSPKRIANNLLFEAAIRTAETALLNKPQWLLRYVNYATGELDVSCERRALSKYLHKVFSAKLRAFRRRAGDRPRRSAPSLKPSPRPSAARKSVRT